MQALRAERSPKQKAENHEALCGICETQSEYFLQLAQPQKPSSLRGPDRRRGIVKKHF